MVFLLPSPRRRGRRAAMFAPRSGWGVRSTWPVACCAPLPSALTRRERTSDTKQAPIMVQLGYKLSSEEHPPSDLIANARRAEEVGFGFGMISDHYHPWVDAQGQSPFVWSVIGGISQATQRLSIVTGVTCPTVRIHPAIIAQAAATSAALMPGRFMLGVGTGENLNEHILGDALAVRGRAARDARGGDPGHARALAGRGHQPSRLPLHRRERSDLLAPEAAPADLRRRERREGRRAGRPRRRRPRRDRPEQGRDPDVRAVRRQGEAALRRADRLLGRRRGLGEEDGEGDLAYRGHRGRAQPGATRCRATSSRPPRPSARRTSPSRSPAARTPSSTAPRSRSTSTPASITSRSTRSARTRTGSSASTRRRSSEVPVTPAPLPRAGEGALDVVEGARQPGRPRRSGRLARSRTARQQRRRLGREHIVQRALRQPPVAALDLPLKLHGRPDAQPHVQSRPPQPPLERLVVLPQRDQAYARQRERPPLLLIQVEPLDVRPGLDLRQDHRVVPDRPAPVGRRPEVRQEQRRPGRLLDRRRIQRTVQHQPRDRPARLAVDDQHDGPPERRIGVLGRRRDEQRPERQIVQSPDIILVSSPGRRGRRRVRLAGLDPGLVPGHLAA